MGKKISEIDTSVRSVIVFMKLLFGGGLTAAQIRQILSPQISVTIAGINGIYRDAIKRGFDDSAPAFI